MNPFDYRELLALLAPELIVALGALAVLFGDQAAARHWTAGGRNRLAAGLSIATCLAAAGWLYLSTAGGRNYEGMLVRTALERWAVHGVLWLTIFTSLAARAERFTPHIGEFFALILLAALGMTIMASTEDLLVGFVALELASLSLYVLAGFQKTSRASAEAALKYFLFGSAAAAATLFGISLLAGTAGGTGFDDVGAAWLRHGGDPVLTAGLVLVGAGFAFKAAAAPFHLWAPDAYQGAPAPAAAFFASGSKLAAFFLFGKLFAIGFPAAAPLGPLAPGPLLAIFAVGSMLVGNLAAIGQRNFRRLLAYSAIAQAGYALLGTLAGLPGQASVLYFMFTYGLSVIGLFAIAQALETDTGELTLEDFAGLSQRNPLLALCLSIFILSLAGIPPLAGFFGKFYLFLAALRTGGSEMPLFWLVAAGLAASAISLYYYLQVLKQAWVIETPSAAAERLAPRTLFPGIGLLAVLVVVLGVFPDLLLRPLETALGTPPIEPAAIASSFETHPPTRP